MPNNRPDDAALPITTSDMDRLRQIGRDAARRGQTKLLLYDPKKSKQEHKEFEYILQGYLSHPAGLGLMLTRQAIEKRRELALEDAGIDSSSELGERLLQLPSEAAMLKSREMRHAWTAGDRTFLARLGIKG